MQRQLLKSEIRCKSLCTEEAKMTEWLFGDELKNNIKDAELGERITRFNPYAKNWRGMEIKIND